MTARHGSAGPGVAHRGVIYVAYTEGYYQRQRALADEAPADEASLAKYMERDVFMLPANATVREALDVGSDHPVTIPVSTSFEDICRLLSKSGVKKIPVVSDGQVVGIASRSAITTYLVRRFLDQAGM